MEQTPKDFSTVELQAMGYVVTKEIHKCSQTLLEIDNELARRAQEAQKKPNMEENTTVEETPVVETTEETTETVE